jgi:hypothetical protein
MSPRKSVNPGLAKLEKRRREPVSTFFTLSVNQAGPNRQPELKAVPTHSFVDCKCNCETVLERFKPKPQKHVVSDSLFTLSIMCSTNKAVEGARRVYKRMCKLEPPTQTTSREAALKSLIQEFAQHCEHAKILRKMTERPYHFVPYPIIPRSQVDEDGVPLIGSDSDSNEENERPDGPVVSNFQAVFAFNTIINNALTEKLEQKLPRSSKYPRNQMPGCIYIMKSSRIPDMVKIGVTTKDPAVRREQLDRCYPTIQIHAYTSEVPYARLVENVIHIELLAQRYMEECSTCQGNKTHNRSHTEWFKITEQLAEQVVMRWAKWMGSRPYHTDTRELSLIWANRLQKAREKGYRPGVDHILCNGNTWQNFTDMRRPKGARDDSGAIELTRCVKKESPFSD